MKSFSASEIEELYATPSENEELVQYFHLSEQEISFIYKSAAW